LYSSLVFWTVDQPSGSEGQPSSSSDFVNLKTKPENKHSKCTDAHRAATNRIVKEGLNKKILGTIHQPLKYLYKAIVSGTAKIQKWPVWSSKSAIFAAAH